MKARAPSEQHIPFHLTPPSRAHCQKPRALVFRPPNSKAKDKEDKEKDIRSRVRKSEIEVKRNEPKTKTSFLDWLTQKTCRNERYLSHNQNASSVLFNATTFSAAVEVWAACERLAKLCQFAL